MATIAHRIENSVPTYALLLIFLLLLIVAIALSVVLIREFSKQLPWDHVFQVAANSAVRNPQPCGK